MGTDKIKRGHITGGEFYERKSDGFRYTGLGVPQWAKEIEGDILYMEIWSGGNKMTGESDYIFEINILPPKFERIK